jgi:radical SAM protein with 4Fe4S-binding SPASM domain
MENDFKIIQINENNSVYIVPSSGFWTVFNYTAKMIIESYLQGLSNSEIAERMSEAFGIPAEMISEDIQNCIKSFEGKKETHNTSMEDFLRKTTVDGYLTIHLTDRCNLKCPYCYKDASNTERINRELSINEIIQAIEIAKENGFKKITFSGGEPTLWNDFEKLLNELQKQEGVEFHLITNGTTVLSDTILKKMSSVFESIQISLDSYDEEKNSSTRGKGSLGKVIDFSKRLFDIEYKNFFYACTPYTHGMRYNSTIEDLPLMLRFAANMRSSGLYVNHLKPDGRQDKDDYKNFDEQEFWENADKLYEEYSSLYRRGYNKKDYNRDFKCFVAGDSIEIMNNYSHKTTCGVGVSQLTLDCDGNVYPCSALIDPSLAIGNIKERDFNDIIQDARHIYEKVNVDTIEKCKECDYRLICGGGCRAMAYYTTGNIKSCDPNCDSCKNRIQKWMDASTLLTNQK